MFVKNATMPTTAQEENHIPGAVPAANMTKVLNGYNV